jgi:hypothetical protein
MFLDSTIQLITEMQHEPDPHPKPEILENPGSVPESKYVFFKT